MMAIVSKWIDFGAFLVGIVVMFCVLPVMANAGRLSLGFTTEVMLFYAVRQFWRDFRSHP